MLHPCKLSNLSVLILFLSMVTSGIFGTNSIQNLQIELIRDREAVEISFSLLENKFDSKIQVIRTDIHNNESLVAEIIKENYLSYFSNGKFYVFDELIENSADYIYTVQLGADTEFVKESSRNIRIDLAPTLNAKSFLNKPLKRIEIVLETNKMDRVNFELRDAKDIRVFYWMPKNLDSGKHYINLPLIDFETGKYSLVISSESEDLRQLVIIE